MRGFLLMAVALLLTGQSIIASNHFTHLTKCDTTRNAYWTISESMSPQQMETKALSYEKKGDFQNAELYYSKLVYVTDNPLHLLDFANVLKENGKCKQALFWFRKYANTAEVKAQEISKFHFHCNINSMEANKEISKHIEVKNLTEINSTDLDFSPAICKSGIVFTSTRQTGRVIKKYDKNMGENYTDLYYAPVTKDGEIGEPEKLKGEINGKYHDGVACFNETGSKIYFTRNFYEEGVSNAKLSICSATKQGDKWVDVKEIDLNLKGYSSCHPAITRDGKRMYFSSNRPGGHGAMDLYVTLKEDGKWGEPINLGKNINSEKNEIFPSISSYDILYYASNGRNTMGGLDIFMSQKIYSGDENSWMQAFNMGAPFNSKADDFGYVADDSGFKGYFNSDRNQATQDDLFSWEYSQMFVELHQRQNNPFTSSIAAVFDAYWLAANN